MQHDLSTVLGYQKFVSYLRHNCKQIHLFGLGMIQVKTSASERFHFYLPDVEPTVEDPHDHRYEFTSTVLAGKLEQTWYTYHSFEDIGNSGWELASVSCNPNDSTTPQRIEGIVPMELGTTCTSAGDSYSVTPQMFHTIKPHGFTVTHLVRGEVLSETARIFRKVGSPDICPFAQHIPESELWEMIESQSPKTQGYHLEKIPKGVVGEISKILEETHELLDAKEQGVKIMELVELSDIYGAVELYLQKHHPGMTMGDLQSMSEVTQRAFMEGYR